MFDGWGEFYLMAGSAAAVLVGLIFVVVTPMQDRSRSSVLAGSRLYRPRKRRSHFAVPAFCLALSLAVPVPSATVAAHQPVPEAAPLNTQFDIRFVPREQRKPVPYEIVHEAPVFRALVNGRDVWAVLGNTSPSTVIDEALARSLGLDLIQLEERAATPNALRAGWRVPAVDIAVPGQIGMRAPVFAADLSRLSAFAERPVSLILGREYFEVLMVVFTPGSRQFQLGPSGSLKLPADTPHLVLQGAGAQVEVVVAGRPTMLDVDLAYNGDIKLGEEAWYALGLHELPAVPNASLGFGGEVDFSVATTLDEVMLGPRRVTDAKVALTPNQPADRAGSIGFGLLSRFNFAIDVKAGRLWLIPPFSAE